MRNRRILLRAGIDSEIKLLRVASTKEASAPRLALVAWLLPRWPGKSRSQAFFRATLELLSHNSAAVRAEAVSSIGLFRLRAVTSVLVETLDDPAIEVRKRAILGLGLQGDSKALPTLLRLLADRRSPAAVRDTVADALSGFAAAPVSDALVAALSDRSAIVRFSAAHSLGELRVRSAAPALRRLALRDRNPRVRSAARSSLARI
jgi:HEAT repeat protein